MSDVENAYRLIAPQIHAMEECALQSLGHIDPFIEEVVRYSFRFGGKRLRPALLFLSGKVLGDIGSRHIDAATAIEFVHTASLIHDDILDGASIRRHLETINLRWSPQVGVLAGDLILTKAMDLMSRDNEIEGFRILTDACQKTCEGELRQIGTIGRFDITEQEYLAMIAWKTAPLLACSTELGVFYSGADSCTRSCFRLFGHQLGLAFQIIDDILDIIGEDVTAGKTLRTDLCNRKPTLPLILYLRDAKPAQRQYTVDRLQSGFQDAEIICNIISEIRYSGAVDQAFRIAQAHIDEAVGQLKQVHGNPAPIAALTALARYVVERKS